MAFKIEDSPRARRIGTNMAEINIIPLVDVVLVLLLIFMLTAPMMYRGIDVNLPKAASKPPAVESAAAHVAVLAAVAVGAFVWGRAPSKPVIVNLVPSVAAVGSPQGRASLPPRVEEAKPPRPPELPAREAPRDLPARDLPP